MIDESALAIGEASVNREDERAALLPRAGRCRCGRGGLRLLRFGDEGRKRNGGEINLLGRHFRELGDRDFDRVRYPLEIGRVGRLVPLNSKKSVLLMKFFTMKYLASPR